MTAPTAPAIEQTPAPETFSDPMDAMEATIKSTLSTALTEPAADTPAGERQRDEQGRFTKAADSVIPPTGDPASAEPGTTAATAADGSEPALADAERAEIVIPEGFAAVPALPDEKVGGRFTVADAEGEIAAPDLTWKFTANGQPVEVSTDKLVAYAQMGKYNHDREQAMQQTQTRMQQVESRAAEVERLVDERDQQIERLLADPEFLLRAQVAYEQQNTPEAKLARERESIEQQRQQIQWDQAHRKSVEFVDGMLAPVLERIATDLPTVSREELASKLFLAADPYRQQGVLTERGFQPIKQYIVNDLVPWAQQLHDHRQSERQAPKQEVAAVKATAAKEVEAAREAARIQSQKAKNLATRTLKPAGQAGQPGAGGGQRAIDPKSIRTGKDAESAVIANTMASLRAG